MTVRALLAEALQFGRDLGSADTVSHLPDGALAFVFGVTQLGDPWLLVAVAVASGIVALPRINEKVASQLPASIQNFSR